LDYDGIYIILAEVNEQIGFENNDDYTINKKDPYWLYFSIYKHSQLDKIIDIIRNKWLLCGIDEPHDHNYFFAINDYYFSNTSSKKFNDKNEKYTEYTVETSICSLLQNVGESLMFEYDSILTTKIKLTLIYSLNCNKQLNKKQISEIKNSNQIYLQHEKILLFNSLKYQNCKHCNQVNNNIKHLYCKKCKDVVCIQCLNKKLHKCYKKISTYCEITNEPRTCVICTDLEKYKLGKKAINIYENMINNNILYRRY
jgi:hypothetical protein